MPQKRPDYLPNHFYHFYNRGAHKVSIFREPDNYFFVLGKMKKVLVEYKLALIAYCLMPNHYHFLLRQDGQHPASLLPQRVFNSYSKAYNKRYGHSGTLFEDHYKVRLVLENAHLLHLCRYIHGNPVKDGLVADPGDWPYSNYLEWTGQRNGSLYAPAFVHEHFPSPELYREFVFDDLHGRDLSAEIKRYLDEF
jgi:putative transposase